MTPQMWGSARGSGRGSGTLGQGRDRDRTQRDPGMWGDRDRTAQGGDRQWRRCPELIPAARGARSRGILGNPAGPGAVPSPSPHPAPLEFPLFRDGPIPEVFLPRAGMSPAALEPEPGIGSPLSL